MAGAWEVWVLWWLSAFQFAVGYWWWTGPHLESTRRWVSSLFVLNGVVTLLSSFDLLSPSIAVGSIGKLIDRWTNLFLLGVGLIGLDLHGRQRERVGLFLGAGLVLFAFLSLVWLGFPIQPPEWINPAFEAPLLLAGVVTGAALVIRSSQEGSDVEHGPWLLVLSVLGMRYAELSIWGAHPWFLGSAFPPDLMSRVTEFLKIGSFGSIGLAFLALGRRVLSSNSLEESEIHEAACVLLLAGFLFGLARRGVEDITAVVLTFALVRPTVFLLAQARLREGEPEPSPEKELLIRGSGVFGVSLAGVLLAHLWTAEPRSILLVGISCVVLGLPVLARFDVEPGKGSSMGPGSHGETTDPSWPVEADRVSLPEDWRNRIRENHRRFLDLPSEVREAVAGIPRWQRIILALDGAPSGDRLPPFERTTPGLHFRTHCPYSSIGPEISRLNERADRILEDLGLRSVGGIQASTPVLVEEGMGRAEGLDSPRVKHYVLTDTGERVAQQLCEGLDLGDREASDVARLVGEGFSEEGI